MAVLTSVTFRNIPNCLSEETFREELFRVFGDVFVKPHKENRLSIKMFRPDNIRCRAVVSGFEGSMAELERLKLGKKFKPGEFDIVMIEDFSGERDATTGRFTTKHDRSKKRELLLLAGTSHRKVNQVFRSEFLDEIGRRVFDGSGIHKILYTDKYISKSNLALAGDVLNVVKRGHFSNLTEIRYQTLLDTFQAIRYLNKNDSLGLADFTFQNQEGTVSSICSSKRGLGKREGCESVLEITATAHANGGFIPFALLDESILNHQLLANPSQYRSSCWRCEGPFILLGVDVNLNFVAGKCKCDYDSSLEILDENRAYFWKNEPFTRLVPAIYGSKELLIWHSPMKTVYESTADYRDTVLPILQEEWNYTTKFFSINYACHGKIVEARFIETIQVNDKPLSRFGFKIMVEESPFWNVDNFGAFREVTLVFKSDPNKTKKSYDVQMAVKLLEAERCMEPAGVLVFTHAPIHDIVLMSPGSLVGIIPKPDKSEYQTTKHVIQSWASGNLGDSNALDIVLKPSQRSIWGLPKPGDKEQIPKEQRCQMKKEALQRRMKRLNVEQKQAVQFAKDNIISFIHGPPGCGKTDGLSNIGVQIKGEEKGFVLATAPSNVAADNLAKSLSFYGLKSMKTLRIYSNSMERSMRRADKNRGMFQYSILHDEVWKAPEWSTNPKLRIVREKIRTGNEFMLTEDEIGLMKSRVKSLERRIMLEYDFLVCTVNSIADQRVANCSKRKPIYTILVDEVGQLTQPQLILLFSLMPRRTVIAGDHKQLNPLITSFAASMAGLSKSLMEWVELSGSKLQNIPWTQFKEQYRMVPAICKLDSDLFYNSSLRNGHSIATRPFEVPEKLMKSLPFLRNNSIVVFEHQSPEERFGTSYRNNEEANTVAAVYRRLLENGVEPKKITILTYYDAQKKLISEKVGKTAEVLNVDGYQGKENNFILLSLSRCNDRGNIGFAKCENRLNVAISRARFVLLIFGNLQTFADHGTEVWKKFIGLLKSDAVFVR